MVESIGICETHELLLDRSGECEMCRLSLVPSKAPPSSSSWWALIIPLLLLGAGIAWALSSFGTAPEATPQRGVQGAQPRPAAAAPVTPERSEADPKPETAPPTKELPTPDPNLAMDEIPVPQQPSDP
ncbi:MAG: hypothetical protein KJN97_10475 [Deltaproteobacteria bacterium]|nr:hypothetical protein [Deltaproteobacteria bacterium]